MSSLLGIAEPVSIKPSGQDGSAGTVAKQGRTISNDPRLSRLRIRNRNRRMTGRVNVGSLHILDAGHRQRLSRSLTVDGFAWTGRSWGLAADQPCRLRLTPSTIRADARSRIGCRKQPQPSSTVSATSRILTPGAGDHFVSCACHAPP